MRYASVSLHTRQYIRFATIPVDRAPQEWTSVVAPDTDCGYAGVSVAFQEVLLATALNYGSERYSLLLVTLPL